MNPNDVLKLIFVTTLSYAGVSYNVVEYTVSRFSTLLLVWIEKHGKPVIIHDVKKNYFFVLPLFLN
jgi:hypothetical protein